MPYAVPSLITYYLLLLTSNNLPNFFPITAYFLLQKKLPFFQGELM